MLNVAKMLEIEGFDVYYNQEENNLQVENIIEDDYIEINQVEGGFTLVTENMDQKVERQHLVTILNELRYQGVMGEWFVDTEEELKEDCQELLNNPDMFFVGQFDTTQEIDEYLVGQGYTLYEIAKMSLAQYGKVLDVICYQDQCYAFIGNR